MLETFMDDEDMEMLDEDEDDLEDEPVYFFSFICPNCEQEIDVVGETMVSVEEINCPNCGNAIPMGTVDLDDLKF